MRLIRSASERYMFSCKNNKNICLELCLTLIVISLTLIVLSLEPEMIQSSWKSTVWESVLCILYKSRSRLPEVHSNTYKLPSL